jgi:hypothetical protein
MLGTFYLFEIGDVAVPLLGRMGSVARWQRFNFVVGGGGQQHHNKNQGQSPITYRERSLTDFSTWFKVALAQRRLFVELYEKHSIFDCATKEGGKSCV